MYVSECVHVHMHACVSVRGVRVCVCVCFMRRWYTLHLINYVLGVL